MTLGERILLIRRRRGLTQQALADQTGLNKNTVSRLEQGSLKDLGGQSVAKMAVALGVSTDYLLGLKTEEDEEGAPCVAAVV
jgi:transcriptional regulator with XRE-family HTH domain